MSESINESFTEIVNDNLSVDPLIDILLQFQNLACSMCF